VPDTPEERAPGGGPPSTAILRSRWWVAGAGAAAIAVVAVIAALRADAPSSGTSRPSGDATGSNTTASVDHPGLLAVAYQGEDQLGGRQVDVAGLLGRGKPVILNFWAGLCPPCRAEMPSFQRVHDEYKDSLTVVGVDIGPFVGLGSNEDGRELLAELGITYPTAYALASPVEEYRIRSMPTTLFVRADGTIAGRHAGFLTEERLQAWVQDLVSERP
jgi:thiol-disulfide isomerase/thioredoxin